MAPAILSPERHDSGLRPAIEELSSRPEFVPIQELKGRASLDNFLGLGGMAVNATYLEPVDPADVRHNLKVGLGHGWGGPQSAYTNLAKALARRGVAAFTFDDSRSFGWLGDFNPLNYAKVAEISSKVAWTAMKIVEELTEAPQTFVMYGHSLSGQTVTDAASFRPDKIKGIIIDGSCGAEEHDFGDSLARTIGFGLHEFPAKSGALVLNSPLRLVPDWAYHVLRNPFRTVAEGIDAGSTTLHERLSELGKLGVKRVAIQSANDVYSPADAVERDSGDVLDKIHRREDPDSGHLGPQLDPEGTADVIVSILDEWRDASITLAA